MKRCVIGKIVILLTVLAPNLFAVDNNPKSVGTSTVRNAIGSNIEGAVHNPALLGVDRPPSGGLLIAPFSNYGVGVWSDKLALTPFHKYQTTSPDDLQLLLSNILAQSFRITDKDLQDTTGHLVSEKLTRGLKGGASVYAGGRATLASAANNRWAIDLTTHIDQELRVPEGPFYLLFSDTKGLQRGNTLDFSTFRQELLWATDLTFSLGLPVSIPELHDLFKLRYGAGGVSVKYIMGHSFLRATMEKGSVSYQIDENELAVDGHMIIQSAGSGLHGNFKFESPFQKGLPINGHGIGADIGGILYDNDGTMTVNVQNLGAIFWLRNTRSADLRIRKDDLDFYDIVEGIRSNRDNASLEIFDRNKNEYLSDARDSLKESEGFVSILPMSLNIGYVKQWDLLKRSSGTRRAAWGDYAKAGANYEQQLSRGPGRSFVPRISVGSELGALRGMMPLRAGVIVGGPERLATTLGWGFQNRNVTIDIGYKAIGHLLFYPARGMELSAGMRFAWGFTIDPDKDGVVGQDDLCPYVKEDRDGFKDDDGCPDYDNDGDGIPDTLDKCMNDPEDFDCFQDQDGCPDYDNDNDGVPDSLDQCPNVPEDLDGFEDEDGCPELDNDKDGIPDAQDKCMNEPEDSDGFQDHDGCPDPDNDGDGIPDSLDRCPDVPEVFNNYLDGDGCPDTLVKPTQKEETALRRELSRINFKTASAELTTDSYTHLLNIAEFLKRYPHLRYEIQGHTDSQGDDEYNLLLSAARASTVRSFLLSKGISDSQMVAIGYGETRPLASNTTAQGRAQNRRVQFEIIETREQYEQLMLLEAGFRNRVRESQIKGHRM